MEETRGYVDPPFCVIPLSRVKLRNYSQENEKCMVSSCTGQVLLQKVRLHLFFLISSNSGGGNILGSTYGSTYHCSLHVRAAR